MWRKREKQRGNDVLGERSLACGPCSVRIGGCSGRLLRRAGLWLWCVACVPSREERLSSWLWLAAIGGIYPLYLRRYSK